ncbi:TonB-dependent receptor [Caulobacter sp. KR2-114]|uniref:TonB-dependent receptor n=1 Tax=Caulobacter sp. KR2-114 TaxID=3400912 RepID=UPI003BFE16BF
MTTLKSRLYSRTADVRAWRVLAATAALATGLGLSTAALAADATSTATADADTGVVDRPDYGVRVEELTVTAVSRAQENAPSKAPLQATQPTSIITHDAIDQFVAQTGDYTEVILLTPSISGVSFNGPGLYEAKSTLRGFQDGQYNITYDGIPFADTNDPTHHSTSFFPSSNIGAVAVERGPGAAGQLGQANFGGSVNIFSPEVGDTFGGSEQVTYGSWNTAQSVSLLNTGAIDALHGTKALIGLSALRTDGALTHSGAYGINIMTRAVVPLWGSWKATLFTTINHTHVYQDDNNGATLAQIAQFGKYYALNDIPGTNQYYKINQVNKHTDFEYIRLNGDVTPKTHIEDTTYTYYYDNNTWSPNDVTGTTTNSTKDANGNTVPGNHIPGYVKANHYRVVGNILRVNQDIGIGVIKAGLWYEWSGTHRYRYDYDMTASITPTVPNYDQKPVLDASKNQISTAPANIQFDQHSSWHQYQPFVDFELKPNDRLTLTPGFKWLHFERDVWGPYNQKNRNGIPYSATYEKPLYFFTANYRLRDNWSVYGQFATGFLVPPLSVLQTNNPNTGNLKPQETRNYQIGTVFQSGRVSFDADVYYIDFNNLLQSFVCAPGSTTCTPNDTVWFNSGGATYKGFEGEATINVNEHLYVFGNGSVNFAEDKANPYKQLSGAPRGTAAIGAIWRDGPWKLSISDKYVAEQWANNYDTTNPNPIAAEALYQAYKIRGYHQTDFTASYTIEHWRLQASVYNLFNSQSVVKVNGAGTYANGVVTGALSDQYYFQPPRSFQLSAKYSF